MKFDKKKIPDMIFFILVIAALIFIDNNVNISANSYAELGEYTADAYIIQPEVELSSMRVPVAVKGIYLTSHTAGSQKFYHLLNLIKQTELNAMVIDIKDDMGNITFESRNQMVKFVGANQIIMIKDIDKRMKELKENNIYTIARIVTFKDNKAASKKSDLAIKSTSGTVWRDYNGIAWLNPYNRDSWEYVISIAEEAIEKGFDEIQFDYVRFPTDGNRKVIDYGKSGKEESKSEAISSFLEYATQRLRKKGVFVSADVFGQVTTDANDMGLGQNLEDLATCIDVISPMVYPSHYYPGVYGVEFPDLEPYKIVYTSMNTGNKRIQKINHDGPKAILRPWLQDFTASYLKENYQVYGSKQVRDQIQAAYDSGLEQWLLWNASNVYTRGALLNE